MLFRSACEGLKPVVAIYSTFLQRAYDQLIHDVALQNLPMVFALDRAGLVGALLLGLGIEAMNSVLSDEGQEYFQTSLMLLAAGLIVQMVLWMRRHGRRLKRDMEESLGHSVVQQRWWGVFGLAAIAVAREQVDNGAQILDINMDEGMIDGV